MFEEQKDVLLPFHTFWGLLGQLYAKLGLITSFVFVPGGDEKCYGTIVRLQKSCRVCNSYTHGEVSCEGEAPLLTRPPLGIFDHLMFHVIISQNKYRMIGVLVITHGFDGGSSCLGEKLLGGYLQ